MNDISLTLKGEAYAARHLHLPAETAMALTLALSDPSANLPRQRYAVELAIDDLIAFLDDTDGDTDLEPGLAGAVDDREGGDVLDEPHDEIDEDGRDISWPERGPQTMSHGWLTNSEDDEDSDVSEDDGCAEPSLASPEIPPTYTVQCGYRGWDQRQGSQERWAQGNRYDGENNVEDEGEATNEDGGDIQDEPHDEEPDGCAADEMTSAGLMSGDQKAFAIAEGQRLLAKLTRQPRRDPDELTIVGPGVGRIGAW